jgi:hypothetical protein
MPDIREALKVIEMQRVKLHVLESTLTNTLRDKDMLFLWCIEMLKKQPFRYFTVPLKELEKGIELESYRIDVKEEGPNAVVRLLHVHDEGKDE